jgi:secreted trypsin-like serine protease
MTLDAQTPGHERAAQHTMGVGIGFVFEETKIGRHSAVPKPPPESEHASYALGTSLVDELGLRRTEDSVVKVRVPSGTCSGALVDPAVVLTALHCVNEGVHARDVLVAFEPDGVPLTTRRARTIVVPRCAHTYEGGGDIAALVLDGRVDGIPPMRVRRARPPVIGEVWLAMGYGPSDRVHVHASGTVTSVSDTASRINAQAEHGDSGGPAVDLRTGELVGVVSRGNALGTSLTRVDVFADVLDRAETAARTRDPSEELFTSCGPV